MKQTFWKRFLGGTGLLSGIAFSMSMGGIEGSFEKAENVKPAVLEPISVEEQARRQLIRVIQEHPDRQISEDFAKKLASGQIRTQFTRFAKSEIAAFEGVIQQGERIGVFTLSTNDVAQVMTSSDREDLMLVLYHEYQHYLQFMQATDQEIERFWRPLYEMEGEYPRRLDSAQCLYLIEKELEAYRAEVRLSWKLPNSTTVNLLKFVRGHDETNASFEAIVFDTVRMGSFGHMHPECFLKRE